MHISYNNFITEVNNLNKRMGDLRDINGEAGTWVRLLNGSGSADGGFTDHYTLLQMGADRKHELGSMDLFTGVMVPTLTQMRQQACTAVKQNHGVVVSMPVVCSGPALTLI